MPDRRAAKIVVPIVSLILLLVGAYLSTRLDVFNSPPSGVQAVQETVPKATPERERTASQERISAA